MSFRLRKDESVHVGLKRIASKELGEAVRLLEGAAGHDEAVHEARKSVKKTRAALLLVKPQLDGAYSRQSRLLRKAGHALSQERDADIIVEAFDHLRAKFSRQLGGSSFTTIRRALFAASTEAKRRAHRAGVCGKAVRRLRKARRCTRAWRLTRGGFADLRPILKRTFRGARKAFARAENDFTVETLHDWRKAVKEHWYQMRLLQDAQPAAMHTYTDKLHQLETWLGDDHNLVILRRHISSLKAMRVRRAEKRLINSLIAREQAELRGDALALGRVIYEPKPRVVVQWLRQAWKSWRRGHRVSPRGLQLVLRNTKQAA